MNTAIVQFSLSLSLSLSLSYGGPGPLEATYLDSIFLLVLNIFFINSNLCNEAPI